MADSGYSWFFQSDDDTASLLRSIKTSVDTFAEDATTRLDDVKASVDTSAATTSSKLDSVKASVDTSAATTSSKLDSVKTSIDTNAATTSSKLDDVKTSVDALANKQPSRVVKSKVLVLDSSSKDAGSTDANPTFTLPTPITCAADEYIQLTLMRFNAFHDWDDVPVGSQITFQKTGQTAVTLTLGTYGKPPIGNIATAIKNAWISAGLGAGFNIVQNQNTYRYVLTFAEQTTMTVLTNDLARYMNVSYNTPIVSVSNRIETGPVRAQKTINLAICVSGVTPLSTGLMANTTGALANKNVLCHMPVLSNSYILFNYRPYVTNEQSMRVTDTSISSLTLEYLDTKSGLAVPLAETCTTLEINTYKQ